MEKRALSPILRAAWFILLFFAPSSIFGKTVPIQRFNAPKLIETVELRELIRHPSVRIVDMRGFLPDYLKGHIPNAVYLHFETLRIPRDGVPAQLPDRICLERLLGLNLGVSNDMWVVVYSEKSNPNATYLAWILDYLGHKKTGVLDGGWEKWASEDQPIAQEYPSLAPKKFFGKVIHETIAEKKWVQKNRSSKDVVIVDVRSPKQYSGEEGEEIRKGHIPGARSLFWETTLEGNEIKTWRKPEDLQRQLASLGIVRNKEIVVHCRTGREASHVYFTLKHVLGYPEVRLYGGSWVEWSADKSLPVKTGLEP